LDTTLGLAGFSNGEAQKGGTDFPKLRPQRYFIRQTFGLGGEQEEVADGPLQLPGRRAKSRCSAAISLSGLGS
jgi:high affinity Mn2+ porin